MSQFVLRDLALFVTLYYSLLQPFTQLIVKLTGVPFEYFVFLMRCASRRQHLSTLPVGLQQALLIEPR